MRAAMILVTGTKRSGTSMWMQILRAAGYPTLGSAFPRDWAEVLRDANPDGFYESHLRDGIYYASNPHPRSGAFLAPEPTRRVAVKVFAQGLVKSDLAYVDRVVATVRPVHEYVASLGRLYALERDNRAARAQPVYDDLLQAPDASALMWWDDNYSILRDALIRRYPVHVISYASVLRAPEHAIGEVLDWLGSGDRGAAVEVVRHKPAGGPAPAMAPHADVALSPELDALCDELYARIDQRVALDAAFIARLNAAHDTLAPRIGAARAAIRERRHARHRDHALTPGRQAAARE